MDEWHVWGDGPDALFSGTGLEAEKFLIDQGLVKVRDEGLYLEDPEGNEYEYDFLGEKWQKV